MLHSVTSNLIKNSCLSKRFIRFVQNVVNQQHDTKPSKQLNCQREAPTLNSSNIPNVMSMQALEQHKEYAFVYVELMKYLAQCEDCPILNEGKQRLVKAIKHTVPYGRQFEGLGVINTYKLIETPENLTEHNMKLAHVLSWCAAMQAACYLIRDDIMDKDKIRKSFPCWNTLSNIGISALNDSSLIQNAIYDILKTYFSKHHCYLPTLELFFETNYKIALGQAVDVACTTNGKPRFAALSRKRFDFLAYYKSASYCNEFPLRLAMYLAGIYDAQLHIQVATITSKIGSIFMAHNDVEDSFGETEVVGKESTDIANAKCSWLVVEFLERCTHHQKQIFMEHFGIPCANSVQIIKSLYKQLQLDVVYANLEKHTIQQIDEEVKQISNRIPKAVFDNFLTDVTFYRKGHYYN